MNVIIYHAGNSSLLPMIEQVLKDNGIPYTVTGASDIGIGLQDIEVKVSEENAEIALDLVKQILN